jgi:hypothetical protein
MAYTTINKSTDYFNTKLYTGNGGANSITGVGFQPDFVWMKNRSTTLHHVLQDAVRGTTKAIYSNLTAAEETQSGSITAFDSDGFTFGSGTMADVNGNGNSFVSWNWKANGQGSSNTAGTINTTYTSANTTAGFSIITYTGNGTANATIGHGLGVEPSMILFKRLTSNNWIVYHKSMGTSHYLVQNLNNAKATDGGAWCTPSSTLIQLNQVFGATNVNGANYVAYCFAEKTGYSKFGSYIGNGSTNGTFVYTGFRPAFFYVKNTGTTDDYFIYDNKRDPNNVMQTRLRPNTTTADTTNADYYMDFLSNGFKFHATNAGFNASSNDYIYMAFGQSIVGSNNIPATAR